MQGLLYEVQPRDPVLLDDVVAERLDARTSQAHARSIAGPDARWKDR